MAADRRYPRPHALFPGNHDEQRIASDFFAGEPWAAYPAHIVSCLLHTNPYMLYAGQELGERGMDKEGFSGRDGRSTIFDYWSMDSVNHGYFDIRKKTPSERKLMDAYKRVMLIAEKEKAASRGLTFDLMYVNGHLAQSQYAFLRKKDDELLLVVVNFAAEAIDTGVIIPSHAFVYMSIAEGDADAVELLSDGKAKLHLAVNEAVNVAVPAHGGVVYKIKQ